MKAARIVPGPQGGHLEIQDVPTAAPGPDQVLVRVMAAGLNRGEIKLVVEAKAGEPKATGVEFAGIVDSVGAGVDSVRPGDHVAGHGFGGQAEYVVAAARAVMRIPRSLPWHEAAAFPNVFITAHDAVVTNGNVQPGDTVLVNAASSGIGLAAIQIAKLMGASKVIATSRSAEKLARMREYGATHVIDVSKEDQVKAVNAITEGRGVDIVVDSVGASVFEANLKSMAVGGSITQFDMTQMWLKRLKLIGVTFRTRSEEERLACIEACARDLLPHLEAGRIKLAVDSVYPLARLADAHVYMQADRHFGKIVIAVDPALVPAEAAAAA